MKRRILFLFAVAFMTSSVMGCTSSYQANVTFFDDKEWNADVSLSFPSRIVRQRGGARLLDVGVQEDLSKRLGEKGIDFDWRKESDGAGGTRYSITMRGKGGLPQLKQALFVDDRSIAGLLEGPVLLRMTGYISKGQVLVLTLPSNPSTGYAWTVVGTKDKLRQLGPTEFQSALGRIGAAGKQTIRLEGLTTGQTTLELLYIRPWMKNENVMRSISLKVSELNALSDLSIPVASDGSRSGSAKSSVTGKSPILPLGMALPSAFDWRTSGKVTSVKDQGSCGSCWAFGTVAPMESALMIQQGLSTDLAEQYLVSCNTDGWGCNGGWTAHDYHWWKIPPSESEAGAVLESDFPYVAGDVSCSGPYNHPYKLSSWHYVGDDNSVPPMDDIKTAIYTYGPVMVAVCAGTAFQSYTGGVFATDESSQCSDGVINHAVTLVGWDDSQGSNGIWILKNSWGEAWGESGYMRIARGISNIGYSASYVVYQSTSTGTWPIFLPLIMR